MPRQFVVPLPGGRRLQLGTRTLVMGIINVTPDSFSDGGDLLDPARAIEAGVRLAAEGAEDPGDGDPQDVTDDGHNRENNRGHAKEDQHFIHRGCLDAKQPVRRGEPGLEPEVRLRLRALA